MVLGGPEALGHPDAAAFENAIAVCSAIGGSTNAPIQLNAIARHVGVELDNDDWERVGYDVPLLVNLQPAGEYLGEEYYRAGGVPAVVAELIAMGRINREAITVNGRSLLRERRGALLERPRRDQGPRRADASARRLPQPQGQPLRQRDHEDVGDLGRVPRALPREPGRSERLRGPRRGLRRARGLPRAHRRPGARDRRAHRARDPRCRADRLSGRGRGRQHARAGLPAEAGIHRAALHRRRAPVGHLAAARRSSTPRPRRRPAAGSRCCRPATGSASTSASAPRTS